MTTTERRAALLEAASCVLSMDLGQLFGDSLSDSVDNEELEELQRELVNSITSIPRRKS